MAEAFPNLMKTLNTQIQNLNEPQAWGTWRQLHQGTSCSSCSKPVIKRQS